jgi:hypothetical protein
MKSLAAALALVLAGGTAMAETASAPSAATMALARQVAAGDDFLALVQLTAKGEIAGIERKLGDLTPDEKAKVEAIGAATMAKGMAQVVDKMSAMYAATFTPGQLKDLAAFLATPSGKAYAARLIKVLPALGEGMKGFDFKREVLKETCAQIQKGCPPPAPPKPSP